MEWSDQHCPRRAIDISKQKNDEQRCTNFCSSLPYGRWPWRWCLDGAFCIASMGESHKFVCPQKALQVKQTALRFMHVMHCPQVTHDQQHL
jgi:hypothetical protein